MSKYELRQPSINPQATSELHQKSFLSKFFHGNILITLLDIYMEASPGNKIKVKILMQNLKMQMETCY